MIALIVYLLAACFAGMALVIYGSLVWHFFPRSEDPAPSPKVTRFVARLTRERFEQGSEWRGRPGAERPETRCGTEARDQHRSTLIIHPEAYPASWKPFMSPAPKGIAARRKELDAAVNLPKGAA